MTAWSELPLIHDAAFYAVAVPAVLATRYWLPSMMPREARAGRVALRCAAGLGRGVAWLRGQRGALIGLLLKSKANVESPNDEGETALMTVARTGNVEAARLLLKAGAKVNAVEQWRGQTALMWAAAQGNPDMVRLLLKSGASPDTVSFVRDWARKVTAEPRPQNRPPGGFTALLLRKEQRDLGVPRHARPRSTSRS